MFLVNDQRHGATHLVFTYTDPRKDGCMKDVVEGVSLDYDMEAAHRWEDGEKSPDACVGVDPADASKFKVFRSCHDLQAAGFDPVAGRAAVFASWRDYWNLRTSPPAGDEIDEASWFDYLDRVDDESRLFRNRVIEDDTPVGGTKDEVAAWLASKHFLIDSAVREIWYLPADSPPNEIRLLELSERIGPDEGPIYAVDYGLNMEGVPFRLVVADANTDWKNAFDRPGRQLPQGWSLDQSRSWTRSGKR